MFHGNKCSLIEQVCLCMWFSLSCLGILDEIVGSIILPNSSPSSTSMEKEQTKDWYERMEL